MNDKLVIYIHGFCESGFGVKQTYLKSIANVVCPSLSNNFQEAITQLENIIESNLDKQIILIGTSLGGLYSQYLHSKYNLKCLLLNPVYDASITRKLVGTWKNFDTKEEFQVTNNDIDFLESLSFKINSSKLRLALGTKDAVIRYRRTLSFIKDCVFKLYETDHRMNDCIEMIIDDFKDFLFE